MSKTDGKKNDLAAKVLLSIPLGAAILCVLLFILACFLERPTSRGTIYSFSMLLSMLCFGFCFMPGIFLSVIGLIRSIKAKMTGFIVLGILETLGSIGVLLIFLGITFIWGVSV